MTKEELAKTFSFKLAEEIGKFKVCRVNRRNKNDKDKRVCHSHDFTDANQVMIDALAEFGEEPDLNVGFTKLIDDAWTLAKKNLFYLTEMSK